MAEARKKFPEIILPAAPLRFPALTNPDFGSTQYPKPEGRYIATAVFRTDSAAYFQAEQILKPHYEEARRECERLFGELPVKLRKELQELKMAPLFEALYDKETEEPTGEVYLRATMTASGVYKKGPKAGERWTRKPVLFDARGNRMGFDPMTRKPVPLPDIWGGTIAKVGAEVSNYFVAASGKGGLKLSLTAVQILDLKTGGERSAEAYGFGVEAGGYEYVQGEAGEMVGEAPAGAQADTDGDF